MIFTDAKKFYPLYVTDSTKEIIVGAFMTKECLEEAVEMIGGSERSKEISNEILRKEFKIINDVELY